MRVCPKCSKTVNDDKAGFCPTCGEKLPKELGVIKNTKLRFIGLVLMLAGVTAFISRMQYDVIFAVPLVVILLMVINLVAMRRKHLWSMISCEVAVVVQLYLVWGVVQNFGYLSETHNFGTAYAYYFNELMWFVVPFAVTIVGTVAMALAKKEFKD